MAALAASHSSISSGTVSSPASVQALASLYKACGDELRLEILRALKSDSFGVLELCEIFGIKQSAMSHHLKVLSTVYLVQTRREGNSIFYQRGIPGGGTPLGENIIQLFTQIDNAVLGNKVLANIGKIKQQRANLGKAFFSKHLAEFREQQELIAHYEQYCSDSLNLLLAAKPANNVVLELGSGDGRFLKLLSPIFKKVIALDYSSEMLNQAKVFAVENDLDNVQFLLGETQDAVRKKIKVDALVMNMVLHHLPSPADCFNDIAALLNKNGVLVLTDLCHHEQNWAKDACGDLWLGFKESDLKYWAEQAGLQLEQSRFLGLRNGFQVLFCSFRKI